MKRKGKIFIGTSGWHYKHWKGVFYPEGMKEAEQLNYYLQFFSSVEINNSFYKLPPTGYRYAFEFRNPTWYTDEIYALLKKHRCAFCIYELAGHLSPLIITAGFVYLRLHGPGNKYQGNYTRATLKRWARKCQAWQQERGDVYVYFDNDQAGYAVFNAQTLQKMIVG